MKKLLLILWVVMPLFCYSQNYLDSIPFEDDIITFTKIIEFENFSSNQLYNKTKLLISDIYKSGKAVIDIENPNSSIVVKGISYYPLKDWLGTVQQKMEHTLKFEFKDEKIRLTYTNLIVSTVPAECLIHTCKGLKYPKKVRIEHAKGIFNSWTEIQNIITTEIKKENDDW